MSTEGHTRIPDEVAPRSHSVHASDAAEAEYRLQRHRCTVGMRPTARAAEEGHQYAPAGRAAPEVLRAAAVLARQADRLQCLIGLVAAFWLATRQVFFIGVDESHGASSPCTRAFRTTFRWGG